MFAENGQPLAVDDHPVRKAAVTGQPVRNKLVAVKSPAHATRKWMKISAEPILKPNGRMDAVICTYHDVTESKQAEEARHQRVEAALRLSEQEFCSLAEAMPQIVWATLPDGGNIYFNHQWVDYTGMTMEESYGPGWNKPFHPDDQQRAWDAWQRATQHNEPYSIECRLRRADGAYRWWLIRGSPMRGENGEILKWFGTCTDIEEMKRAEAVLQEAKDHLEQRVAERTAALSASEQRYRMLFDSMQEGFYVGQTIFDDAGKPCDYAYLGANPAFERLMGLPHDQIVGHTARELVPDLKTAWVDTFSRVQLTGEPARYDTYSDYFKKHFEAFAFRPDQGQFAVLVTDITDRMRGEAALQASLREKEVLLKEIHHRVKNNMQVISSLVNLQADTLDDPALRTAFNGLRDQVRSMALVHEKLYQAENLASVDFAEYARSLLNYLWRAYGDSTAAVRLKLDLQPVALSVQTAVPCGLLLNELVTNALKYAFRDRAGGEITVAMQVQADQSLCLRVSDNGVGFPPDLDWRRTRSLGLQLVQMLTAQLGGTVDLRQDGGTEFRITIMQAR